MEGIVDLNLIAKPATELKAKEVTNSPEETLAAFNRAYEILSTADESSLREQDLATKSIVGEAKLHAIDEKEAAGKPIGKYRVDYGDQEGGTKKLYNRQEGVPVEGVSNFLQWRIDSGGLSATESEEYARLRDTLIHRSTSFGTAFSKMSPERRFERVKHEAYLISIDPNRSTGNTHDDFVKALDDLSRRRILSIPRAKSSEPSLPIEDDSDVILGPPIPDNLRDRPARVRTKPVTVNRRVRVTRPTSLRDIAHVDTPGDEFIGPPIPDDLDVPEEVVEITPEEIIRESILLGRDADISSRSQVEARRFIRDKIREGKWYDVRTWRRKVGIPIMEKMWEDRITSYLQEQMRTENNSFLSLDVATSQLKLRNFRGNDNIKFNRSHADAAYHEGQAKIAGIRSQVQGEVGLSSQRVEELAVDNPVRKQILSDILKPLAEGSINGSTEERRAEVQRRLKTIVDAHRDDASVVAIFGSEPASHFASDLLETGEAVRGDIKAHRYALDQIDQHVKLSLASASWGAETNTEIKGLVDKLIDKVQSRRGTAILGSPGVAGAITSLAIWGARSGTRSEGKEVVRVIGGSAMEAAAAGAFVGAVFAAFRRNHQLKVDRSTHQVGMAYNLQDTTGLRRRENMQRFSYNTASVDQLLSLSGAEAGIEPLGGGERRSIDDLIEHISEKEAQDSLIWRIAEIRARLDLSAEKGVDLITYEGEHKVESGRLKLIQGVVRAKQALREAGVANTDSILGIADPIQSIKTRLLEDMKSQDSAFKVERIKQSAIAGAVGGLAGFAGAVGTQEATAFIADKLGDRIGIDRVAPTILREYLPRVREYLHEKSASIPFVGASVATAHEQLSTIAGVPEVGPGMSVETNIGADHSVVIDGDVARITDSDGNVIESGSYNAETHQINFHNVDAANKDEVQSALSAGNYEGISVKDEPSMKEDLMVKIAAAKPGETYSNNINGIEMKIDGDVVDGKHEVSLKIEDKTFKGTIDTKGNIVLEANDLSESELKLLEKDVSSALGKDFIVEESSILGIEMRETIPVLGPEGVWHELEQPVSGWEWYAYNTPESELNELQMHTRKDGDTLILDMLGMGEAYQHGVEPNPINVPDVIANKEAVFSFTLPNDPEHPIVISDSADGVADGQLMLNPNDEVHYIDAEKTMTIGEFSRIIINEEEFDSLSDGDIATEVYGRQSIFNLRLNEQNGYINAGRLADDGNGGKKLQSFATIRGAGNVPDEITREIPAENKMSLMIKPVDKSEFTITARQIEVPAVIDQDKLNVLVAPPIPTVFVPRSPLESVFKGRNGYGSGYGYGAYGLLDRSDYATRRSRTLESNPNAYLNESDEVNYYFESQDKGYIRELEEMDREIGSSMSEQCRMVFAIPAYGEGRNIRSTLEQFISQQDRSGNPLNTNLYEIVILENYPQGVLPDSTKSEIESFRSANPSIHISYASKAWGADEGGVGSARKYANDLALLRSKKRSSSAGDLILVSNDADLDGISNNYVVDILQDFDSNPELDAVTGKWSLPRNVLAKPNVRAAHRLWYLLDRVVQQDAEGSGRRSVRSPGLIGRNAAFRTSIYSAIGGYNPKAKLAEDLEIGWMIDSARDYNVSRMGYDNRAELISNPRRFLAAMVQGVPLVQMYGDFHENSAVRDMNNNELLSKLPNTFDLAMFEREVEAIWMASKNEGGQYHHLGGRFDQLFKRTMGLIGVEYVVEERTDSSGRVRQHIRVTNVDKLLRGMMRPIPDINP